MKLSYLYNRRGNLKAIAGSFLLFLALLDYTASAEMTQKCQCYYKTSQKKLGKGFPSLSTSFSKCPVAFKLLTWQNLQLDKTAQALEKIEVFLKENPHWPNAPLINAAEQIISASQSQHSPKWFSSHEPKTNRGLISHLEFLSKKKDSSYKEKIKKAWHTTIFLPKYEKIFLKKFKVHLTKEDHQKRLRYILWKKYPNTIRRMKQHLPKPFYKLINAHLSFLLNEKNALKSLSKLSKNEQQTSSLIFQQIKWHLKKRQNDMALKKMLSSINKNHLKEHVEDWWKPGMMLVRYTIREKNYKNAFTIVHNLNPVKKVNRVEKEWLSGWLLFRFLGNAQHAYQHFWKMFSLVETPISKAKAAYWLGRTSSKIPSREEEAKKWFRKSASYSHTFYGQLSSQFLDELTGETVEFVENDIKEHEELLQALDYLLHEKNEKQARTFVVHLAKNLQHPDHSIQVLHKLNKTKSYDLAVLFSKLNGRKFLIPHHTAYPTPLFIRSAKNLSLDPAFLHGVIRQESGFSNTVVSPAGAKGLMQLMPLTARRMAKKLGIPFGAKRLIKEPLYNLQIGEALLKDLHEEFEGNLPLILASYNAGKGHVKRWLEAFGDPRRLEVDTVDWIESIPFAETRSYIHRVMEAIPIYKCLLEQEGKQLSQTCFSPSLQENIFYLKAL